MSILDKILSQTTAGYKEKPYKELKSLIGKVQCFDQSYSNKSFGFEIHVVAGNNDEIKVMVECSRNLFFFSFFSRHRYFKVNIDGRVTDIEGDEYWEGVGKP